MSGWSHHYVLWSWSHVATKQSNALLVTTVKGATRTASQKILSLCLRKGIVVKATWRPTLTDNKRLSESTEHVLTFWPTCVCSCLVFTAFRKCIRGRSWGDCRLVVVDYFVGGGGVGAAGCSFVQRAADQLTMLRTQPELLAAGHLTSRRQVSYVRQHTAKQVTRDKTSPCSRATINSRQWVGLSRHNR